MINFIKHAGTIYAAMIALTGGAVWAADTVFQTDREAVSMQIRLMEYDIQDLQAQMGFADSDREREKYRTRIKIKESQIRQLKEQAK